MPFKRDLARPSDYMILTVVEGGSAPSGAPIPVKGTCQCLAPRIYVGGKILPNCERCGLPHGKGRR